MRTTGVWGGVLCAAVMAGMLFPATADAQKPKPPDHLVYPGLPGGQMRADLAAGVFLCMKYGNLYADDLETGTTRWTAPVSLSQDDQGRQRGGVLFGERISLVYSADGTVSLLDNGTGGEVWRQRAGFFGGGLSHAQLDAGNRWVTLHYKTSAELCEVASGRCFKVSLPSGKSFGVFWMQDGKAVVLSELLTEENKAPTSIQLWLWEPGTADPVKGCVFDSPKHAHVSGTFPGGGAVVTEYTPGSAGEMIQTVINPRTGEKLRNLGDLREPAATTRRTEDGTRLVKIDNVSSAVEVLEAATGAALFQITPPEGLKLYPYVCFRSVEKDWLMGLDRQHALWLVPVEENGAPRRILGDRRFLPGRVANIRPPHLLCQEFRGNNSETNTLVSIDTLEERARWNATMPLNAGGWPPMLSETSGRLLVGTMGQEGNQRKHALTLMASGAEVPLLEKPYRPIALSRDGNYLVAAVGDEGPVFLLDDTGKSLAKYNSEQRYSTGPAAFSPDGRRVAVFHMPRITVTDLAEGFPARELTGQPGTANLYMYRENALCFSPDGNLLLAGTTHGKALLFDANTGKLLHTFVEERRFRDRYVQQQRFLSSLEGMAKDLLGGVTDRAKRAPMITCAFANNGTLALTIADGQILRAWSVRDRRLVRSVDPKLPEERDKHGSINNQILLSPNGDYCLAYNRNGFGIASLWNTVGGQRLEEYRFPEGARLGAVAVADDGKTVYAMIDGDLHFLPGRK